MNIQHPENERAILSPRFDRIPRFLRLNRLPAPIRPFACSPVRILIPILILFCRIATAGPVVNDPETWSTIDDFENWQNTTGDGTLTNPDGEYLRITFDDQTVDPGFSDYEEDTIYIDDAIDGKRVGDFTTQMGRLRLSFSYYQEDVAAASSVIYLHSSATNAVWKHSFTTANVGSNLVTVGFIPSSWTVVGGGDFWTDLATIDWIGVNITRNALMIQQAYGIDNWEYWIQIPEPGTMTVLGFALLSLAATFRKRLGKLI